MALDLFSFNMRRTYLMTTQMQQSCDFRLFFKTKIEIIPSLHRSLTQELKINPRWPPLPTTMTGASGQWCLISGFHLVTTFSCEDGLTTLKHIRNTSVWKKWNQFTTQISFTAGPNQLHIKFMRVKFYF